MTHNTLWWRQRSTWSEVLDKLKFPKMSVILSRNRLHFIWQSYLTPKFTSSMIATDFGVVKACVPLVVKHRTPKLYSLSSKSFFENSNFYDSLKAKTFYVWVKHAHFELLCSFVYYWTDNISTINNHKHHHLMKINFTCSLCQYRIKSASRWNFMDLLSVHLRKDLPDAFKKLKCKYSISYF